MSNGNVRAYALVAVGGSIGAAVRWALGELLGSRGGFPWATLAANLAGCVMAGLAVRWLLRGSDRWTFAVTGFLGGLTTFSAFAVDTRRLVDAGHEGRAILYVAASVVGGLVAVELLRGDWRRR